MLRFRIATALLAGFLPALAQVGQYEGPSILSRGGGRTGKVGDEFARIRVFGSLTGIYDSDLTPVTVTSDGKIPAVDGYGVEAGFGAYGVHNWRHDSVALNYRGNVRHYTNNSFLDGSDHLLSVEYSRQMTRRLIFELRPTAGIVSRSFGGLYSGGIVDPSVVAIPTDELFDARATFVEAQGGFTYQQSARMSYHASGSGFAVRRRSAALFGVNGWQASGDAMYRLSKTKTVGVTYSFMHFDFNKVFGDSAIHQVALTYAQRLGRRWELSLSGGVFRIESQGLIQVELDPVVAALLGQSTGIEAFHRSNYLTAVNASLSRVFRKSNLTFAYDRGVTPGNGIYLTSLRQGGTVNYSYTGIRHWHFNALAGYGQLDSLTRTLGRYQTYYGGGGVSRALGSSLHLTARADYRDYQSGNLKRNGVRVSVGLAFSPGDIPLSLW